MPEWVESLSKIAVAAVVVGVGLSVGDAEAHGIQEAVIGGGILEAILGSGDLLRGIRRERRSDFRRAMNEIKNDVEKQYRSWIEREHQNKDWYQKANIENAFFEINLVIDHCVPEPAEVVDVALNQAKLADLVVAKAARQNSAFSADSLNPAARDILRTIIAQTFERVRHHPVFASKLTTYVNQALLERASRIEDKMDEVLGRLQANTSVPIKLLRDIVIRFGIRDPGIDAYEIEKHLRDKAEEYRTLKERLDRLTNDDPAIVAFRREAAVLIEQGDLNAADDRLARAEERDLEAAKEQETAARRRRLSAAESRSQRGATAALRLDFLKAAEHFQTAAEMVPEGENAPRWLFLLCQGDALSRKGEDFGGNQELHAAVAVYRTALNVAVQERDRAETQVHLGRALIVLGEREGEASLLEQAIAALGDALAEFDHLGETEVWIQIQNLLGNALSLLADHPDHAARLEDAATAYRAVLRRLDKTSARRDWAMTMNNLGTALWRLGEREEGTERLTDAIDTYRKAWDGCPREESPRDWAATQSNLGTALSKLGERVGQAKPLREAVGAYREAMTVYTRQDFPIAWATTESNLGTALYRLGVLEEDERDFEEAVAAYQEAVKERTRDAAPIPWALTQYNLGNALSWIGAKQRNPERLAQAFAAYRESLKEFTRESRPHDWADVQAGIAAASLTLTLLTQSVVPLHDAISGFRAALKVHGKTNAPRERAATLQALGSALWELVKRQRAKRRLNLNAAVAAFDEASALFLSLGDAQMVGVAEDMRNGVRLFLEKQHQN